MMLLCGFLYAHIGGLVFLAVAAVGGAAMLCVAPLARETIIRGQRKPD
jgi:MFS transporter, PPP family, 3-phenylpropionic acid transporter